ncbi:MAG: hypothetical protein NDP13_00205 [Crenarchaeota archaeon]|nr:hypothetical protein [Thermoproteota archaeon]MCR8453415.1 hypothetical protein [Thermoproteota archaeon]MCR8454940.1 hypothetical protein [Thermoproteota archaeon]MCR8471022.1 hypothetical protein [Thermoproteota archaeon]MCR8471838.1 hypothetical protein [Thermoproteota archaeon]
MLKFDHHKSMAKINVLFQPIIEDIDKIEKCSKDFLVELDLGNFKEDVITQLTENIFELEDMYDELMDALSTILQDIPLESRTAKEALSALEKVKDIFEDVRLRIDNLKGFIKPDITHNNTLLQEVIKDVNKSIIELKSALTNDVSKHVKSIMNEYMKFESFLSSDAEIER